MSFIDDARAVIAEMRDRLSEGRCAMPGCVSPPPIPRGFCDVCRVPVIGCWPGLSPEVRRIMMLLSAVGLPGDEARPLPARLLWWRPSESRVMHVHATEGLPAAPPYIGHVMVFRAETGTTTRRNRRRWRRVLRAGPFLN